MVQWWAVCALSGVVYVDADGVPFACVNDVVLPLSSIWHVLSRRAATPNRTRGGLRAGRPSRQLSSCCILPLNVQLDGGRTCRAWIESMEGGHCSNLFELASGNKGAWPARSVSRAIRATPSKSRTWADMPPTFLRARTEALQTARPLCAHISVRSDRLFQTLLFWILRVCAARSH